MMWFAEHSTDASVSAAAVWRRCYADPSAWAEWSPEIDAAVLEGPFAVGTRARVKFRRGPGLRFELIEVEQERVFTDEARMPGARMGHRHLIEPTEAGVRLTNRIYIRGPLARLYALVLGGRIRRTLPEAQRRIVELARAGAG